MSDCEGNKIDKFQKFKFAYPSNISNKNLIINEILFNPINDGIDYVEEAIKRGQEVALKKSKLWGG